MQRKLAPDNDEIKKLRDEVINYWDLRRTDLATVPNSVEKAGVPTRRVSKSRLQVANNLLRRLQNELNLGQVLILLEKIFFDLG